MKLSDCRLGVGLRVESISLSAEHCHRLKEFGISEGVDVKICQNCVFGGKVISRGTELLGIDSRLANAIEVSEVSYA
ncbi:MAG: ferrous iron transport protein A [Candidatus Ancillula trichonymphae]|jgi:Fe2+ transport system protein FeoA|nr:ferrous iron transport protein A [Candidatus Ancillula trichonymphae]